MQKRTKFSSLARKQFADGAKHVAAENLRRTRGTVDADRDAIAKSIHDVVAEVQTYVPGYRLLNEPQFDDPSMNSGGQALVTAFVEVEGAGDYLPPYAGNLDIMTAAATKVGEEIAKEMASVADERSRVGQASTVGGSK